ncbi:MAG: right-handed parallel beta-helix repeat-containing protein, partial [Victivallales bacterium]
RRNTIRDVCFDDRSLSTSSYNAGAILVQHFLPDLKTAYPQENRDISILDNTIEKIGGCGILAISAKGLTISGNKISGTQQVDCDQVGKEMRISSKAAISVNYSSDVIVKDNIFGPRGPYCRQDVSENNGVKQP